jgi:hypothetical protein
MTDATKGSNLPTLIAYSVVKRTPAQSINQAEWTKIGVAWPHRDGRGVTVRLTALPLGGQIYMRMPGEDDENPRNNG